MSELLRRVRSLVAHWLGFRRADAMADRFAEEARFHLEMQAARNLAAGMSPAQARRSALVAFGGEGRYGEAARDEVRSRGLEELQRDVRFSLRGLRRSPGYATAALLTFALGIGATTVVFSITDHVVLRPLDYPHAERLVLVREVIEQVRHEMPSLSANAGHYLEWRRRCTSCGTVSALLPAELALRGEAGLQQVSAARASSTLVPMLGGRAQLGRLFTEADDAEGAERVAVLTDGFWRRQYGARRDVIGRTVTLGGQPTVIVGVLERGFSLPSVSELGSPIPLAGELELLVPLALNQFERDSPGAFDYSVIARLAPGATVERARAELETLAADFSARSVDGLVFHALVLPLQDFVVGDTGRALVLLLFAVGALLAIVCVNLANLQLARNAGRWQESAVRVALGAGRGRLLRQALTESLVLALFGGLLGVVLSRWGLAALLHLAPATLPRLNEIALDGRVLAVVLVISVVAGLAFGALPALRFGRIEPADVLMAQGSRTVTAGRRSLRARELLVATQVGLSALLLIATGLFLGSFVRVLGVDKGFDVGRALAVNVSLGAREYPTPERRAQFFSMALERLGALPGVSTVALTTMLPLEGETQMDVLSLENDVRPIGERPVASIRYVSPGYFAAVGTPLLTGRVFGEADRSRPVILLSVRAARALWPDQDALGKRAVPGSNDSTAEVIGVVADVRTRTLEQEGALTVFVPYWQRPPSDATLLVRTHAPPATLATRVRTELRELAPDVPVSNVRTMSQIMAEALAGRRFQLLILALFAMTALATASIGIYGVVAYSLKRRTTELGVRLALGARPGRVQWLVLRQGLLPVTLGLAAGIAVSLAVGGTIGMLLYDVAPDDPTTHTAVAALLLLVAAIACWIPARQITRLNLGQALKQE